MFDRRNPPKPKLPDAEPMDNPNESLNLLRKMLQMRNRDDISFEELGDILFDVADEFESLDRWLTVEGGYLPEDWKNCRDEESTRQKWYDAQCE